MRPTFWTDEIEEKTVNIFKNLIKIDTSNPPGNEIKAVSFLQKVLKEEGIESKCLAKKENRGNLIAKLEGGSKPPILLLSHLDVVSADGKKWDYPPFSAQEVEGNIWGRGTLDTKQLTVMELISFILLNRHLKSLNRDVYIIASADEEKGSKFGMEFLSENYPKYTEQDLVINESGGFPINTKKGDMLLCSFGEKGSCKVKLISKGSSGHASFPPYEQAVEKIADAIDKVTSYKFPIKTNKIANVYMEKTGLNIKDGVNTKTLSNILLKYMVSNEVKVNSFNIGKALNAIPYKAEAEIEFRILPSTTKEELKSLLDDILSDIDINWEIINYQAGYISEMNSELIKQLEKNTIKYGDKTAILPFIALGRTDGRFLGESADVYGFSPVLNDLPFNEVIKMVHNNNEHISIDSLLFGTKVIWQSLYEICK